MKPRIQPPAPVTDERAWRAADADLTAQIRSLFARCPSLDGFSVQAKVLAEGTTEEEELFVTAISITGTGRDSYAPIFEDIATTLRDLLEERPEAHALLRGRTFARSVH
ncbi:MAG TPA: hypothetical protein VEB41_01170 [Burkholderiales bacterium]|nr:hypothetical protein [Burkholderiales bacterium]